MRGGIYTCPPLIRNAQKVSDAELKRWAIAMLDLIEAKVINYSWVTLARMLEAGKIVGVKLGEPQQSAGLLHACGRLELKVLQRKYEETGEGGKTRTVYCVMREDSVDVIQLGNVYGAGIAAARKLIKEGSVDVTGDLLASRTAIAARKLIRSDYPAVSKQFAKERAEAGSQRSQVVRIEKAGKSENGFTLHLADRLRELLAGPQKT